MHTMTIHVFLAARPLRVGLAALLAACLMFGCGEAGKKSEEPAEALRKIPVRHAQNLRLTEYAGYTLAEVFHRVEGAAADTLRYALYPRDSSPPRNLPEGTEAIPTPAEKAVCLSTTHVGALHLLGESRRIAGAAGLPYVYAADVRRRVAAGEVKEVGQVQQLNMETLLELAPDLVIADAVSAADLQALERLRRAGVPVALCADWQETTPLGRAEWLKFFGALCGQTDAAVERFDTTENAYVRLRDRASAAERKPVALKGAPYQGVWHVPAGKSYAAQFLYDAQAEYPFQTEGETGSLGLDFEAVYPVGREAEFWIGPGAVRTLDELKAQNPRLAQFRAVQEGGVYNSARRATPGGGLDYYESGPYRPDRVLADYLRIFHDGLLPPDTLYYHQRLR